MTKIFTILGLVVFVLIIVPALSLVMTGLWFCFDDKLAEITGVSALGSVPWYNIWPFTLLVTMLFKSGDTIPTGGSNDR